MSSKKRVRSHTPEMKINLKFEWKYVSIKYLADKNIKVFLQTKRNPSRVEYQFVSHNIWKLILWTFWEIEVCDFASKWNTFLA